MIRGALAGLLAAGLAMAVPAALAGSGRPHILWSAAGHEAAITDVEVSPDGTILATSSGDATVKLWSRADGTLVRTLTLPYDLDAQVVSFNRIRFTPDKLYLVAAVDKYNAHAQQYFGTVDVFRVSDGARVREFGTQPLGVAGLDLSLDAVWLATAGEDGGVRVWRFADGKLEKLLSPHPAGVANDVHFSPSVGHVVAGFDDHHLRSWTSNGWTLDWDVVAGDDEITHVVHSNDGMTIATTSRDGTARLFDYSEGSPLKVFPAGAPLLTAEFSPDGTELATGGADGSAGILELWDIAQGTLVRRFSGPRETIVSLRYVDDGGVLLSGGEFPSRLQAWNPADGKQLPPLTRLSSSVARTVFSANGRWTAIAAPNDQRVEIFDTRTGQRAYSWNTHTAASDVALSPDGRFAAMPGANHTVVIRRLSDGHVVHRLLGHAEDVTGVGFSHDGKVLASGSFFPGSLRLWDTADWSLLRERDGGSELGAFGPFVSFSFSPDDTLVGSVGEAAPIVLRVSDASVVALPQSVSRAAAFSPDGQVYVASGSDGFTQLRVFRTSDWTLVDSLPIFAYDIAFTPDSSHLVLGQREALSILRTSDWQMVETFDHEVGEPEDGVQSVAVSPDGTRMAYGRYDATLVMARFPGHLPGPEDTP